MFGSSLNGVKLLLGVMMAIISCTATAQAAQPITVERYDDADDYLPEMERKNTQGIRLYLSQQEGETLFKVLTPRNVTVDVVAKIPPDADFGVVFLLGGTSVLSIQNDRLDRSFSFQPRSRDFWWGQKVATFLIDAPSDRLGKEGISDGRWRAGPEHQSDMRSVLDAISKRYNGPLVVHGHSNGALSVANVAGLNHPAVKAYVYSSGSHYQRTTDIVYEAVHQAPVIFVQHKQDVCKFSKTEVFDQMVNKVKSPNKKIILVDGGITPMGGACSGFAPHSFVGIEKEVVLKQIQAIRQVLFPKN